MNKEQSSLSGTFDSLYNEIMVPFFASITDHRRENASYDLVNVLKSGFAIFSLKI